MFVNRRFEAFGLAILYSVLLGVIGLMGFHQWKSQVKTAHIFSVVKAQPVNTRDTYISALSGYKWAWAKNSLRQPATPIPLKTQPIPVGVLLKGVVSLPEQSASFAMLVVDSVGPVLASVGTQIQPEIWLNTITKNGVLLKVAHSFQWLGLGTSEGSTSNPGGENVANFVNHAAISNLEAAAHEDSWKRVEHENKFVGLLVQSSTDNMQLWGIREGDLLVSIENNKLFTADLVRHYLAGNSGSALEVIRNQKNILLVITK
jgi:hypothetical protein